MYKIHVQEWNEDRIRKDGYNRCQFVEKKPIDGMTDSKGRCTREANYWPHHKSGRHGPMLHNKRYFMAVCEFPHHRWIHEHAREARKRGYLLK